MQIKLRDGRVAHIRKAAESDATEMIAYLAKIGGETDFLTFGAGELDVSLVEQEKLIEKYTKCTNGLLLVATVEEKVIGILHFSGGDMPRIRHCGEFGVSIFREHWGNGIGKAMVRVLLDWAHSTGIVRKINLRVRTDNNHAISLYKQLGFREEGVLSRYFCVEGTFFDVILMGKFVD